MDGEESKTKRGSTYVCPFGTSAAQGGNLTVIQGSDVRLADGHRVRAPQSLPKRPRTKQNCERKTTQPRLQQSRVARLQRHGVMDVVAENQRLQVNVVGDESPSVKLGRWASPTRLSTGPQAGRDAHFGSGAAYAMFMLDISWGAHWSCWWCVRRRLRSANARMQPRCALRQDELQDLSRMRAAAHDTGTRRACLPCSDFTGGITKIHKSMRVYLYRTDLSIVPRYRYDRICTGF
eukprot:SAG11_NODE_5065_length_1675_cov_1.559645_1_plen_235_part_00